MYTVYVLYSKKFNKTYTEFTSNITDRYKSHHELATKGFTLRYRPWIIAYKEVCESNSEAMKREKFLKSGQGRVSINTLGVT